MGIYLILVIIHMFVFFIMWNINNAIAQRDEQLFARWNEITVVSCFKHMLLPPAISAIIFITLFPAIYATIIFSLFLNVCNVTIKLLCNIFCPFNNAFWDVVLKPKVENYTQLRIIHNGKFDTATYVVGTQFNEMNYKTITNLSKVEVEYVE